MWNTQKYLTNYVLFHILNGTSNLDDGDSNKKLTDS